MSVDVGVWVWSPLYPSPFPLPLCLVDLRHGPAHEPFAVKCSVFCRGEGSCRWFLLSSIDLLMNLL